MRLDVGFLQKVPDHVQLLPAHVVKGRLEKIVEPIGKPVLQVFVALPELVEHGGQRFGGPKLAQQDDGVVQESVRFAVPLLKIEMIEAADAVL